MQISPGRCITLQLDTMLHTALPQYELHLLDQILNTQKAS